jgi:diguanylate cyclase (GGDEF)-like protein
LQQCKDCIDEAKYEEMKRFFVGAILIALLPAARFAAPEPLTSLAAIHRLTNAEAAKQLPVAAEGTVTYFRGYQKTLTIQDGDTGIYVMATTGAALVAGDRVLVKGATRTGPVPIVVSSDITLLEHGALPKPIPATFGALARGQYDSELVTMRGVVITANADEPSAAHTSGVTLGILVDGGYVEAELNGDTPQSLESLLDAEVAVTGVAGGRFDGKMQHTGALLRVANFSDIKILKSAATSPWALPVTSMNQIPGVNHVRDLSGRVTVTGIVTYYEPGVALVLQSGPSSLWISTASFAPIRVGDEADATGFPTVNDGFVELTAAEIRDSGVAAPVSPLPASWQDLTSGQHIFDLVSTEGQVVTAVRSYSQDEYVLVSKGYEFSAIYRHPDGAAQMPMKEVQVGSLIRVVGVCVPDYASPHSHNVHFDILLSSPDDIVMLAPAPWLTVDHLILLGGLLLIVALVVGARGWFLERKIRRDIGSLAYVEQRRGRILEEINNSEPLAEILERITELVSVRLNGAPCWCQIADGAALGNRPERLASAGLRIVEHPIASRSGPPLGTIFAAFHTRTRPNIIEAEALRMAAELATLAIETSRLYSDLVRRSEFDLLTDVQNRFAMEKTLDALILAARQSAGIFGLIYIDLNEFKQVNDVHGHLVGDLYLQEVAQRMKRQLRPGDMLARLGGDEFAVLVPEVRNRAEIEEIAQRLESCFQEPFIGDGYVLQGSASIGLALYPEDATTADNLLNTADAAMYVAKYTRPRKARAEGGERDSEVTQGNRR